MCFPLLPNMAPTQLAHSPCANLAHAAGPLLVLWVSVRAIPGHPEGYLGVQGQTSKLGPSFPETPESGCLGRVQAGAGTVLLSGGQKAEGPQLLVLLGGGDCGGVAAEDADPPLLTLQDLAL